MKPKNKRPAKKVSAVFRSECGNYLCRCLGWGTYEAWSSDGQTHWKNDDRVRTWADAKRRLHPLRHCVGSYSAEQYDQPKGSFTLYLLTCDTKKYIKPWTGNTVVESRKIVFRRRVPDSLIPRKGSHE